MSTSPSSSPESPDSPDPEPSLPQRLGAGLGRVEGWFGGLLFVVIVVLLTAEIVLRAAGGVGVPGAVPLVRHLTLWLAFLGAALAASEDKMLALATGQLLPDGRARTVARALASTIAAAATALLARASLDFLLVEKDFGDVVAYGVPVWVALLVLPVALAAIALRLIARAGGWPARAAAIVGLLAGLVLGHWPQAMDGWPVVPVVAVFAVAMLAGAPLFAVLGGLAVVLFAADAIPMAAVPVETYQLAVSPTLPAIPLFTLTGFLLAEGRASERLIDVFRALVGWIPGGTAVVAAVVCAFFTVFTGGSGVTILALGGLLFQALSSDGYRERFSIGLLTASGSLGLLLPPALPLILYGIVAEVPIPDLFLGGVLPGLLLVLLIAAWGVREGLRTERLGAVGADGGAVAGEGPRRQPFALGAAGAALWRAKWELLLPGLLVGAILGGWATPVEAAALSVVYAVVLQCIVHRDLHPVRDLPRVLRECTVLVGGVLIILCVAMGLTSYLVDAQVPMQLLEWVQTHVDSPLVFLLMLNLFLLLVGCLMDIFSATVVVVPLIVPLGLAYGIHPVHLGIIFIANLELGYLTPPVGLNLFLASYRFERPLLTVYRAALPMLVILGIGVLLITYVPWLTTALLGP